MKEYTKIETVFERDMEGTKKLIEGEYRNETVAYLKDNEWICTEKIDGTNIGVIWDGHKVSYQGRTERAQVPTHLMNRLIELFGGRTKKNYLNKSLEKCRSFFLVRDTVQKSKTAENIAVMFPLFYLMFIYQSRIYG